MQIMLMFNLNLWPGNFKMTNSTICLWKCEVDPHSACQGNNCIQPEGAGASQVLNECQEGLTHNGIGDPVASGCSPTTQAPQLQRQKLK